jgi:hypothetical protein
VLGVRRKFLTSILVLTKCRVAPVVIVLPLLSFELNVPLRIVPHRFLYHRRYLPILLPLLVLVLPTGAVLILLLLLLSSEVLAADPQLDLVHVLLLLDVLDRGETEFFRLKCLCRRRDTLLRGRTSLELWDQLHIRDILTRLPIVLLLV